jgi:hypothetical protein
MTLTPRSFAPLTLCLGLLGGTFGLAGEGSAEEPAVFAKGGIAIAGYDVVVYFTENRAVQGSMENALMWHGATWLFVSEETMQAFEMNPKGYAPQYGGYCAYAVAQGETEPSDPEVFTVLGGKLYLNNSPRLRDVWSSEASANISIADQNWPGVLNH